MNNELLLVLAIMIGLFMSAVPPVSRFIDQVGSYTREVFVLAKRFIMRVRVEAAFKGYHLGRGRVTPEDIIREVDRILSAPYEASSKARTVTHLGDRRPPKFAEYLLYFLPKKDREPLLGDLEEEYHTICGRFGRSHGWWWYNFQVAISFWPLIVGAAKKLVKWGVLGWVGDLIRRVIT